ncbi:hypothetical protein ACFQ1M_15985 [Sungkyunkwania multivorans]|uniref:Uncharacterized protein n=1 Tax=Sungkyunkwania multivorans TaxID=1173618 RepID=A0ABW3D3T5_9FLAO
MKKKSDFINLSLKKFRISKIDSPNYIFGGSQDNGDDQTDGDDPPIEIPLTIGC